MLITEKKLRKIIREIIKESHKSGFTYKKLSDEQLSNEGLSGNHFDVKQNGEYIGTYPEDMLVFKDGKLVGVSATQSKQYNDKDLPPELRSTSK